MLVLVLGLSPPDKGSQASPLPDTSAVDVAQNLPTLIFSEPAFISKPAQPEIKVSELKDAFFFLPNNRIFRDKALPESEPSFLHRLHQNQPFSPKYFVDLHERVSAPGLNYPKGTYNSRLPCLLLQETWETVLCLLQIFYIKTEVALGFCRSLSREILWPQLEKRWSNFPACLWSFSPSDPGLWRLGLSCLHQVPVCVPGPEDGVPVDDGQAHLMFSPLLSSPLQDTSWVLGICFLLSSNKSGLVRKDPTPVLSFSCFALPAQDQGDAGLMLEDFLKYVGMRAHWSLGRVSRHHLAQLLSAVFVFSHLRSVAAA